MTTSTSGDGRVERVASISLVTTDERWPFAAGHAGAISAHWQRRVAENPAFFNGRILVLRHLSRDTGGYKGVMSLEQFADFLYWRDGGFDDGGTLDGFGSALVRSAEGHVLLARHAAGTLNAGRIYLPGGFLDARDVRADGTVDLDGAVARELAEETGLTADLLVRRPGYLVTREERYCSLAVELRSPLPASDLLERVRGGIRDAADGELTDVVVARSPADLDRLPVLSHARRLVAAVLTGAV